MVAPELGHHVHEHDVSRLAISVVGELRGPLLTYLLVLPCATSFYQVFGSMVTEELAVLGLPISELFGFLMREAFSPPPPPGTRCYRQQEYEADQYVARRRFACEPSTFLN